MPAISFLESHTESVQIFVHHVKEGEGVNNGLILTFLVKLNVVTGECVTNTEVGTSDSRFCNVF